MCGIVGITSKNEFSTDDVLAALKRLEYRGYDSFGFATDKGVLEKDIGEIRSMRAERCTAAVAHTRWSTHGSVTKENAHPHADCTGSLFVAHNGIIENYEELKNALGEHNFRSETDSEVIAHYIEERLKTKTMNAAIMDFMKEARGTFAVVILQKDSGTLYAMKRDSPLVLGLLSDAKIIASDIYAFSDRTKSAIFFEDNEFAEIDAGEYVFYNSHGIPIDKFVHTFSWKEEPVATEFAHHMLKEIHDQPAAAERLIGSLGTTQKDKISRLASQMKRAERVIFVAAGTSYHATLIGVYLLHKAGIDARTLIASEFKDYAEVGEGTLVIALSQSGETMDIIDAIKIAKAGGAKIASFVNVPYSSIQRMSDVSIELCAGQEICVAATKSFTNEVVALAALAKECGYDASVGSAQIESALQSEERIKEVAHSLRDEKDIYIIGRGIDYPIAREIALKLKEIAYVHAEGMMAGELKHGTLALIEKDTPVIALLNGNRDTVSNVMEVKARGARVIAISDHDTQLGDEAIVINAENALSFALSAAIAGQLLTYYIAKERELPIDKPRNLAKSVTVK